MKASVIVLALALRTSAAATTHLVCPDGTGEYPTIQAAITATFPGDTIVLADGTFRGEGNRDLDYVGKAIVIRSQAGSPAECTLDCEGSSDRPHRAFGFHSAETESSVLESITVVNGWAYPVEPMFDDPNGGAIYCFQSAPTIRNCVFTSNSAGHRGGAIFVYGAAPRIEDCTLADNSSETEGGGICLVYSDAVVTHCRFAENISWRGGGADCRGPGFRCQFRDCWFMDNQAAQHGGGLHSDAAAVSITSSQFLGNVAQVHGGAIKIDFASNDPSYVTSCTVSGNTAAFGGGLALLHGLAYVDSCTIYENTASHQGGGVWVWDESMWMRNSTLAQNTAPLGASVSYNYLYHDTELLENTILAFGRVGQAVYYDGAGTEPEFELTCCDIYGNAGGDWVGDIANQYGMNGNISLPPLFCGDANPLEPYTLHSDSPCAPGFNPDCSLIGAWPVGCGAASDLGRESQPAPIGSPDVSFPNPFVAGAAIRFDMHVAGEARLTIHDVSGRVVRNLTALPAAGPGSYRVAWDGKGDNGRCVCAGVYFARLTFVSTALTRQLDLIK